MIVFGTEVSIQALIAGVSAGVALLSAAAAWGAVFFQRKNTTDSIRAQINIAARNSRAAVVSANRQKWIDALREDISELMAAMIHYDQLQRSLNIDKPAALQSPLLQENRDIVAKYMELKYRIGLRLNPTEADHQGLIEAISKYIGRTSGETEAEVRRLAAKIFKAEWERLKKEASGVEPFVK